MKTAPLRIFISFILFSFSGLLSITKAADIPDTIVLVINKPTIDPAAITVVPPPSNVIYPASLQNHRAQTIDYIEKFSNRKRSYLISTYQKGKKYFPKVTAMLKLYELPQELRVLLALESGFKANAVSRAGAVGYWQIMDEVGREYGMHIVSAKNKATSKKKDDRKNLAKSTQVAVKYLRDRCRNLNNDLLLIVAAYNCGIGNVWDAMKKSGKRNPDFWDIKKHLPAETRNYVMNFITLNVIFANYENFAKRQLVFNLLPPQNIAISNTYPATTPSNPCEL
jgi:Transglycosylase SLT domain